MELVSVFTSSHGVKFMIMDVSREKLIICMITVTILFNFFQYYCVLFRVKFQNHENKHTYKIVLISNIFLSISVVFLVIMFLLNKWGLGWMWFFISFYWHVYFLLVYEVVFLTGKNYQKNILKIKRSFLCFVGIIEFVEF